jgi:hypothetical protein
MEQVLLVDENDQEIGIMEKMQAHREGLLHRAFSVLIFNSKNELLLQKYADPYTKLKLIFERTISLIDTYHPDEIAIEAPFFGKNVQSMLKLGRAQGVAMAAGLSREIPITEYLPKKIKMAYPKDFFSIMEPDFKNNTQCVNLAHPFYISYVPQVENR